MKRMYKIAVMGDRDSIYGFASVGLDIYPAGDPHTAARRLRTLVEGGYAVVYITEALYTQMEKELRVYNDMPLPAIIPIPGVSANTGIGIDRVRQSVKKAVGSDIIFGSG